jgi:polyisoprenoid-binding protein YceI
MEFTVEGIEPSFPSITDKADVLLTIRGRLRIRDVERPLALLARARLRDGTVWVRGDGALKMTDFGLTPPTRMFLKVADKVAVRFDLVLTPEK